METQAGFWGNTRQTSGGVTGNYIGGLLGCLLVAVEGSYDGAGSVWLSGDVCESSV